MKKKDKKTHQSKYLGIALGVLLMVGLFSPSLFAEELVEPPPEKPIKEEEINPRLETVLQILYKEYQEALAKAREFAQQEGITLVDNTVRVIIEPEGQASANIDRTKLEFLGATVEATSRSLMQARIPIGELIRVANEVGGISFIRLPLIPVPSKVDTSEGVAKVGATGYHSAGFKGQNVKVAIIDLGFNHLTAAKSTNDLPASVIAFTKDYTGTGLETGSQHGTNVAEIVHDMAPQAKLYLMKISNSVHLENAKDRAIIDGVKVINHSVVWFNAAFYDGTGVISDIAADARNNGILWVNAAGNEAHNHWQGGWSDPDSNDWLNFTSLDECQQIGGSISAGDIVRIYITWNAWPHDAQDYDLYLYKINGTALTLVAWSENWQTGTQPPTEYISYDVTTTGQYGFAIYDYNAPGHRAIEVYVFKEQSPTRPPLEHQVNSSSIPDPGNDQKVFTVGAIDQANWTTGPLESFSSRGPSNNSKFASARTKPDIMGPDGVSTSGYSPFYFYGTSASSPHVAGAAALLLSENPARTASNLQSKLASDAIDMGPAGKDNLYGWGRLNLTYLLAFQMEVGQATINHNWTTVKLSKSFINPVVIAKPLSYNGSDPATVRIKNVTPSSFKIRVQEWDYLNGTHTTEKVSYLVVEKGTWTVGGNKLRASSFSTNKCGTASFASVSFSPTTFSTTPVVLSSVGTFNGADAVVTRIKNVTKTGFKLTMQEQEKNIQSHTTEKIYWIAWEPGTGTIEKIDYQVAKTANVTHNFKQVPTKFGYRYLWVDEETSLDLETSHTSEIVGWAAFSGSGFKFLADLQTTNGADPANLRYTSTLPFSFESGEVSLDHHWKTVNLTKSFINPVVIAKPLSYNGSDPATVRIKNVTPSSFKIRVQEWDYLNGTHTTEKVSYLVVEKGTWTVGGNKLRASSFSTNKCGTASFASVSFSPTTFSTTPVVLSSVGTFNGADAVVTRIKNVTKTGFKLTMQEQEKNIQSHTTEKIYWIAWEPGSGTIGGKAYQVAKASGINHNWKSVSFSPSFASTPALLVDLQTTNGTDPANLRYKDKTRHGFKIQVDEEKSSDSETTHANENIGYVAIASGGSATALEEEKILSLPLEISQALNYPNPFHSETAFSFSLTRSAEVTIKVYTVAGELIKTIGSTAAQAGYHEIPWDGRNDYGEKLANGVYLYRIVVNSGKETVSLVKKLAVLR